MFGQPFSQLDSLTGRPTDPRSMNRFAYAEANPWTFSDPSGHATCFSTSDLCDEQMAIQHHDSQAGRDAARRGASHDTTNYWYNRALKAKPPARIYETAPATTVETDWASQDTWGEDRAVAFASASESAAQAAAVRCTRTRVGMTCQSAQQQADWAATSAGIGDAFGDIWDSALHLGSCVGAILNCADVGLGLATIALDPVGTGMATGQARRTAIASGDKRAGAHAITSTLIDVASLLPVLGVLKSASVAEAAEVTEGIYEFPDATADGLPYVGNSGNIPLRLIQHVLSGKLKPSDLSNVRKTAVPGGRTAREIAEQLRINEHGGVDNLGNKINVIGPDFQGLMQTFKSVSEYLDYLDYHLP